VIFTLTRKLRRARGNPQVELPNNKLNQKIHHKKRYLE